MTLLITLLIVCLVPYGWFAQQWPALNYVFNVVFHSWFIHMVGHSAIFALIGMLILWLIPALRSKPATYAALILLLGLGQEGFQILYKGHVYIDDTLGDILTDVVAAMLVWAIASVNIARAHPERTQQR